MRKTEKGSLSTHVLRILAMEKLDDDVYRGGNSLTRLQLASRLKVPFTEGVLAQTLLNLTSRGHIKKSIRRTSSSGKGKTYYRITPTGENAVGF